MSTIDDPAREALFAILSDQADHEWDRDDYGTAERILETLRSLGWQQFRWQSTGDVALGHVQTGYPVFSRDEKWVAFVPEPPAE